MASKLDSILIQLNEILDTLQQDEDKRVIAILQIVQELAQHVARYVPSAENLFGWLLR